MKRPIDIGYFLELSAFGAEALMELFSQEGRKRFKRQFDAPPAQKTYQLAEVSMGILIVTGMVIWMSSYLLSSL